MSNQIDIQEELGRNFLTYALDVDQNKAFPSILDGFAPGARAALWEMYTQKYFSNKPHVKSAKVAAGVIGKWWPHNADATYGTLVRMAQPFVENCCEVDFQGAVGNQIIGQQSYGASRYTEMRLSKLAEEGLFYGIDKDNSDMIWNYLQEEKWPKALPAIFPRLLVNGSQGIGVGVSQIFCLHSFTETANLILKYIKTQELDEDTYYPDFPTGGTIINKDELSLINKTGKGRIILQAKYKINKQTITFYEMPYQVYIEPVIDEIKKAVNGEKIIGIDDVINSSDKTQLGITIICERSANPEVVVEQLFNYTSLRTTIHVNQNAIVNVAPQLVTLKDIVDNYIKHNVQCIKREFQFELEKTLKRLDIIHGLIIAHNHIDEVIKIIREDEQPKAKLILRFDLNETQVNAILDMRLARLSKLDLDKLLQEQEEKAEYSKYCKKVVESEEEQKQILIQRLTDLAQKYGDERRTEIIQKEIVKAAKVKKEAVVEPVVVAVTEDGYIKNVPVAQYRASNKNKAFIKTSTDQLVILFSNLGKMYRIKVSKIKSCGNADKGQAGGALLKLEANERIIGCAANNDEGDMLVVTSNNLIRRTPIASFSSTVQSLTGLKYYPIQDNEVITCVVKIFTKEDTITVRTKTHALKFLVEEVTCTKSKTSKGMKCMNTQELIISAILNEQNDLPLGKRAGVGKKL